MGSIKSYLNQKSDLNSKTAGYDLIYPTVQPASAEPFLDFSIFSNEPLTFHYLMFFNTALLTFPPVEYIPCLIQNK